MQATTLKEEVFKRKKTAKGLSLSSHYKGARVRTLSSSHMWFSFSPFPLYFPARGAGSPRPAPKSHSFPPLFTHVVSVVEPRPRTTQVSPSVAFPETFNSLVNTKYSSIIHWPCLCFSNQLSTKNVLLNNIWLDRNT